MIQEKEIEGLYYHPACVPLGTICEQDECDSSRPLTEPEKQHVVAQIMANTNVPVPKPRTKFRAKATVRRAETMKTTATSAEKGFLNDREQRMAMTSGSTSSSKSKPISKRSVRSPRARSRSKTTWLRSGLVGRTRLISPLFHIVTATTTVLSKR